MINEYTDSSRLHPSTHTRFSVFASFQAAVNAKDADYAALNSMLKSKEAEHAALEAMVFAKDAEHAKVGITPPNTTTYNHN